MEGTGKAACGTVAQMTLCVATAALTSFPGSGSSAGASGGFRWEIPAVHLTPQWTFFLPFSQKLLLTPSQPGIVPAKAFPVWSLTSLSVRVGLRAPLRWIRSCRIWAWRSWQVNGPQCCCRSVLCRRCSMSPCLPELSFSSRASFLLIRTRALAGLRGNHFHMGSPARFVSTLPRVSDTRIWLREVLWLFSLRSPPSGREERKVPFTWAPPSQTHKHKQSVEKAARAAHPSSRGHFYMICPDTETLLCERFS